MKSSRSDSTLDSTPVTTCLFAPFAGSIHTVQGELVCALVARANQVAITADGRLINIDRPSEWLDDAFTGWEAIACEQLSADGMKNAIAIVETMLSLPANTLSAESMPAALKVAAASVNHCLLGLQQRLVSPTGFRTTG